MGPEKSWVEDQSRQSELHRIQTLFFSGVKKLWLKLSLSIFVFCYYSWQSASRKDAFSKVTEFNGATWREISAWGNWNVHWCSAPAKFVPTCRTPVCNDVAVQLQMWCVSCPHIFHFSDELLKSCHVHPFICCWRWWIAAWSWDDHPDDQMTLKCYLKVFVLFHLSRVFLYVFVSLWLSSTTPRWFLNFFVNVWNPMAREVD